VTATLPRSAAVPNPPPATGSPPPVPASLRRPPPATPLAAELALVGMTLAAVVDLARLFRAMVPYFVPVALCALSVHLVCWVCRRKGQSLALAAVASVIAAWVVLSLTVLPAYLTYGVPTRHALHAAGQALAAAMHQFRTVTPPAPHAAGFVLAGGFGCAIVAFLADWAAFRMRATIEACLPSLSMFVFSAALAQGHRTALAAAVWLGALLGFLMVREAGLDHPRAAWFASRTGGGPAAVMQLGSVLTGAAVLLAVVIGPHLPGATSRGLINWRHQAGGGGGRTTASPLVDIRARITEQSDVEVFTVAANTQAYWRLTSLDTFDGSGWSLNDTYRHAGGPLPGAAATGTTIKAKFAISNLASIWLPTPYRPVRFSGPNRVSYSPDAGSLIADKQTADGLTYQVTAEAPAPEPDALRHASGPTDDPTLAKDLELPPLPLQVLATARAATSGARSDYDRALMLQKFFRTQFTYDLNVPADDGTNAIVSFLDSRRGFCQQFAGTYAAMARALGIPARVAVGFTPGTLGSDGLFHVRDEHAHAWPELWFGGIGWVAFEPTPGRGAPGNEGYTGVPPQQAADTGSGGPATTATTAPAIPSQASGASGTTTVPRTAIAGTSHQHHRSLPGWLGLMALWCSPLLLVAVTPLVSMARRSRRRSAATTPAAQVLLSWDEAREHLALVGAPARLADTPAEYAERVTRRTHLPEPATTALHELAQHVIEVSYAGIDLGPEAAEGAGRACATIMAAAGATRTRSEKIRASIDPRQLRRTRPQKAGPPEPAKPRYSGLG
jgi:transglutaminase-like putative cysteine protease